MKRHCLLVVCLLFVPALGAHAQWEGDGVPLTMNAPSGWAPMGELLLGETNRQVRHVTGGAFIAGYQAYEAEVLLFPYLLVQFVPYDTLPEAQRPTHRLDERDALQLLGRLVTGLGASDPLPADMDTLRFKQDFGNDQVRLDRLGDDGTFDLVGAIPLADGSGQIAYHTAGVFGREGVAYATVFSLDGLVGVQPVIDDAGSLGFTAGAAWADLPERDAGVVGFLPPPVEPMPGDAVRVGDGAFGLVPGDGFHAMRSGTFDPGAGQFVAAYPRVLGTAQVEQVFTRTPTSRRMTRPWVAAAFAPWEQAGLEAPLERRLTPVQWAQVLAELAGVDRTAARVQLEQLAQDPGAEVSLLGEVGGSDGASWRVESVDMAGGRVAIARRVADTADETLQLRVSVTLVAGRTGLAVLVSNSYTDAGAEVTAAIASMAESIQFVGGERYVDVPPVDAEGSGGSDTLEAAENLTTSDGGAAGSEGGAGGGAEDPASSSPTPATGPADVAAPGESSMALPLVLGGLGVVFVAVVVIVVISTHRKAQRQREKARARRERRQG